MEAFIDLTDVNMYYETSSLRGMSFKEHVFNIFKKQKTKQLIKDIHSLKNINLSIKKGDRVAVLGHNGAGKSTLLKTIAGIYPISSGKISLKGRVRALYELSTGFESEATGLENIMYRGLLLGQSPKEMKRLTEEIVEFVDIGEFIHYPLKTYSAGMQVRLAFAISTLIEGDILLLDEVIGAGDVKFIEKAQKRIHQMIEQSKILMLATHDLGTVSNICNRTIVIDHGSLVFDGGVKEGIDYYHKIMQVNIK